MEGIYPQRSELAAKLDHLTIVTIVINILFWLLKLVPFLTKKEKKMLAYPEKRLNAP